MSSDRVARVYRLLEYAAFGRRLQRHRCHFLPVLGASRRALVLGDGDGRFLAELTNAYPDLQINSVEQSCRMTALAQARVCARAAQVSFHVMDARAYQPPSPASYDLVVTHFFLDCFEPHELTTLLAKVAASCRPGALWVISEFQQPRRGWRAWHARIWLRTMYLFFRVATGLEVQALPPYAEELERNGFEKQASYTSKAGLLASELWRKCDR